MSGLIDMWPSGGQDRSEPGGRARMLRLLSATEDRGRTVRFLGDVVLRRYGGGENDDLIPALGLLGPEAAKRFLLDLAGSGFTLRPEETLALLRQLGEEHHRPVNSAWEDALREGVRAVLLTLAAALCPGTASDPRGRDTRRPKHLDERAVRELFRLAWRYGVAGEAETAAHAVAGDPQVVRPDRALPAALGELSWEEGLANGAAFATLWRHATDFLLARSAEPPEEPRDWTIAADIACPCEHCRKLKAFCRDPDAKVARFPLRKDLRAHLHQTIDRHDIDLDHVTERRGSPYILVCTKNRASHKRRLAEYAKDVAAIQTLIRSAPGGAQSRSLRTGPRAPARSSGSVGVRLPIWPVPASSRIGAAESWKCARWSPRAITESASRDLHRSGIRMNGQAGSPPCSMKSRSIFGSGWSLIAASKA